MQVLAYFICVGPRKQPSKIDFLNWSAIQRSVCIKEWSCDQSHLHYSDVIPAGSSWFQAHGFILAEADSVITAVVVSVRRGGLDSDVFSPGILFGWHVFLAAVMTP